MRKMFALIMAVALAISCFVLPACAVEIDKNEAQGIFSAEIRPREILTLSKTQTIYVGSQYAADITLKYTARSESANSSGQYITGVLNGSIKNIKGWTAVGSVSIDQNRIVYANNHQTASVPVTYQGSIGSGNSTYSAIILIELT